MWFLAVVYLLMTLAIVFVTIGAVLGELAGQGDPGSTNNSVLSFETAYFIVFFVWLNPDRWFDFPVVPLPGRKQTKLVDWSTALPH